MSFLGNLIWLIFGGFLAGASYILGGALLCLTIIGIPFGMQAIKLGVATMAPFDKEIREKEEDESTVHLIFNLIWILLFGWEIAVAHLTIGLMLAVTVIGIPFARQHFKLIQISLFPFSYELR